MASGPSLRRHARRAASRRVIQPLEHARAGEVIVDLVLENDRDQREAEHRSRAHRLHARESLQIHRERIGDLILDLLRTAPRPVGEDDHLVLAEVGNGIDRRAKTARTPQPIRNSVATNDEEAVAQRPFDEAIDHGFTSVPHSSISAPKNGLRSGASS